MKISDYITSQNDTFKVKTGIAVAANDLLQFGPDGRAYPVGTTDYAAVANCTYGTTQTSEATGRIVAQTQIVASQTQAYHRQALLIGNDGSMYACTNSGSGVGIMLTRYSTNGALVNQVTAIGTGAYANHQAFFLSSGDICVIATAAGVISFAIYDTSLSAVKSVTNLTDLQSSPDFSSCPLSGGGFAVIYQYNTTPLTSRFVSYGNSGNVITAPFAVWTRTGTTAAQYHRMMLLSDGNLAVAVHSSNTVSSIGLFYAVLSPAGAIVKAFTNLNTSVNGEYSPEVSVMSGKFAVAKANGTNAIAFIFDNSGTLQGSDFTAATTASTSTNTIKLLNDSVDFWLLWSRNSDSKMCLTKLPNTGTGYVTMIVTTTTTQYNHYVDAFAENGLIIAVSSTTASSAVNQLWVIDKDSGFLVAPTGTGFGVAPGTFNGQYHRLLPIGDFAFACMYDYTTTATTHLTLGKYASTAVVGKANFAATEDALVSVSQKAGGYGITEINGSTSKTFNHSATNIVGNTGTLMNHGAVLKGI